MQILLASLFMALIGAGYAYWYWWRPRHRKERRETVLLYGPEPRLASLPVAELESFPKESRYVVDNRDVRFWSSMAGSGLLALPFILYSVVMFFIVDIVTPIYMVQLVSVPLLGALVGYYLGLKVAPRFYEGPYYIVRARTIIVVGDGSKEPTAKIVPEAVTPDHAIWEQWADHFTKLRRAIYAKRLQRGHDVSAQKAENAAKTLVDPVSVDQVTGHFHSGTMASIEAMDDVAADYSSGIGKAALLAMAGISGTIAIAFIGFIVFVIVVGDERAKAISETGAALIYALI